MKKYGILSIIFLLLSLTGALYLVKNNQDNRNRAADTCWATCNCSCGKTFCANPKGRGCHYECLDQCGEISNYGSDTSSPCNQVNVSEKCLTAKSGTMNLVSHYKCPGYVSIPASGCTQNVETLQNVSRVCVDESLCGVQQIDYQNCFVSYLKICKSSTSTPTPTPTPGPTSTPTSTPTPTPGPTSTPTPTPTPGPTSTPTSTPTPGPTSTPTSTPTNSPTNLPSNTPIPTEVVVTGPSPTRIILPQAGVDFPSQAFTLVGVIVTLFGFLILL